MQRIVVVGGQASRIGKTSLVTALIRAFPEARWTAVKISLHEHGIDAGIALSTQAIEEEQDRSGETDTSRFLVAGAVRAFWVRCLPARLGETFSALQQVLEDDRHVIIESNSILQFLQPDLYLLLLDAAQVDFKESARAHLSRADALVLVEASSPMPAGQGSSWTSLPERPVFRVRPENFCPPALMEFVREHIFSDNCPSRPLP